MVDLIPTSEQAELEQFRVPRQQFLFVILLLILQACLLLSSLKLSDPPRQQFHFAILLLILQSYLFLSSLELSESQVFEPQDGITSVQ